jgi:MFS family permease
MVAITFDLALTHHIGEFGRGQAWNMLKCSLMLIPNAAAVLLWVFLALDPVNQTSVACSTTTDASCLAVLESESPSQGLCQLRPEQWVWTNPPASVISDFNLICEREYLVQLANSITFIGCFFGSGLFGWLCDRIGRKKPLFAAAALVAAATFASLAAPNYVVLVTCRALVGAGTAGVSLAVFLIATESVGPHCRGRASIASSLVFVSGELALVGVAAALPTWRGMTIASGIACASMLLLFPLIEESPRWLLSTGKQEEAVKILEAIAARKRTTMPADPLVSYAPFSSIYTPNSTSELHSSCCKTSFSMKESRSQQQVNLKDVLGQPVTLFQFAVLVLVWLTSYGAWYGITLGPGGIPGSM